ncbi:hypothetical protein QAD02_002426 [Eretmocerus hayati]|uniref:Uncharacterized protein n=1 Tax=Eretmocerus hayati TaxID=131215 RepID=A0ACC2NJ92_9HYME|nr:hypothetical protein QAD02_002426 [Eretmocerus hayati]
MDFVRNKMGSRPTMSSSLVPKASKAPAKKKAKRKRSHKQYNPFEKIPELDSFAKENAESNKYMHNSLNSSKQILEKNGEQIQNLQTCVPNTGTFKMILRKVKLLQNDEYDECLSMIFLELDKLV